MRIGVFGAGVMGRALIKALLDAGVCAPSAIWATARSKETCDRVSREFDIAALSDCTNLVPGTSVVLVCVKPSQISEATEALRRAGIASDTLLISILAGVTLERLHALLPNPWVRSLPNTPSAIGAGMTAICSGIGTTEKHLETARIIFNAAGRCELVDELHLNAVTALCGCSTAYMYVILDAMSDAGVRLGVERDLALKLAAQAMLGSARMVLETGRHPAALRDDVTTPGGGTIAGLLTLEDGKMRSVMARAIEAARMRIDEIGGAKS